MSCSSRLIRSDYGNGDGGVTAKRAQLTLNAYAVLVLSNEQLEEPFCPQCGTSRWCHITKHDRVEHSVRWTPRDLWEQAAHVDPTAANPTVSDLTRRSARRTQLKLADEPRFYD